MPRTLFDKIWDAHVVERLPDGTCVLYIDRHLVHPLSNLMASGQVRGGDLVRVDFDSEANKLIFYKDAEDLSTQAMLQMVDASIVPPPMIAAVSAIAEMPKVANAKSTRR